MLSTETQAHGIAGDRRRAPLELDERRRIRVSVVIPTFNYARYLPEAIESVLSQRGVEVEVIVVDDASTDDSSSVATSYGDRVRLVRHERNHGPVDTFNDGLAVATGEYLVRLDADDVLTPDSLVRAVALAEAEPTVGLVYGRPLHFVDERPESREVVTGWRISSGGAWLDRRCATGVNCITSPEALMRMSVVRDVGGQRALAHTHDMEMWMRIARASDVGWVEGADQAWHRDHAASLSATHSDVTEDLRERLRAFTMLFTDGQGKPEEDAARLAVSSGALATEAARRVIARYARGAGDTAEAAELRGFIEESGADLSLVHELRLLEHAVRLGPHRARWSPILICWAVGNRARARRATRRWERTGL